MSLELPAELRKLSSIAQMVNCADPISYLEDLSGVDIDTIRRVGREVWGVAGLKSPAQDKIESVADWLVNQLYTSVQDYWEGDAYAEFERHMLIIRRALEEEAERLQPVGEALVAVADAFEVQWYEIVGYALSALGLIIGVAGLAIAIAGPLAGPAVAAAEIVGLILSLIGLVIGIAGLLVALIASVQPRLATIHSATCSVDELQTAESGVDVLRERGGANAFPSDMTRWRPRGAGQWC